MKQDAKAQRRKGENELSRLVIGAALDVHRELGPGLLEAIYEKCLCIELSRRNLSFERQRPIPVVYKGLRVGIEYRIDLIVENVLVVELKASECTNRLHSAQLLTYLRLTACRLGLLINFGLETLREGIQRVANRL